jgi:hypothetical protein
MKKVFIIALAIVLSAITLFNVCFAYSNIDCVGCATMLFLGMEFISTSLTIWGFRKLYKQYEAGKLDIFKIEKFEEDED